MSNSVQLIVYDLSRGMAIMMSQSILGKRIDGIWHTGIIVFGKEYYFGGGIQCSQIGFFERSHNLPPVQTLTMGVTSKSQSEFESFLRSINHRFTQSTYDLLRNNCNNFSNEVCLFLTSTSIPSHIVDLPKIVASTPGGQMLMPMLESMQLGTNSQGGLDPFGNTGSINNNSFNSSNNSIGHTLGRGNESINIEAIANQINAVNQNIEIESSSININTYTKAILEEYPLISTDNSLIQMLGKKILILSSSDNPSEQGSALTEEESLLINLLIEKLSSKPSTSKLILPSNSYLLLGKLLCIYPKIQLSCLFFLRLMIIWQNEIPLEGIFVMDDIRKRLLSNNFNSHASIVMGMTTLANFISTPIGIEYIFNGINNSSIYKNSLKVLEYSSINGAISEITTQVDITEIDYINELIDFAVRGFSNTRQDYRQMSSALAYNITLACTKYEGKGWLIPKNNSNNIINNNIYNYDDDIHQHAVQLLCCIFEIISSEVDTLVIKRFLSISLRILRAYGIKGFLFAKELGFDVVLNELKSNNTDNKLEDVILIINDLLYNMTK